jgi:dTDP-4-dehydrorhamnose reductase
MTNLPILITGGSGQIGGALTKLAANSNIPFAAPSRQELDLQCEQSIVNYVGSRKWRAVINCGAYTAVDKAENYAEASSAINAAAPAIIARETAAIHIPIIHVSTDYVFDGDKSAPYTEADSVNPMSVYGRTKEQGETAVRSANPHHAIIRTAWVLSAGNANFLNTMISKGSTLPEMRVVDDQLGNPTSATDVAAALLHVALNLGERSGTWHFVNAGEANWHALADYIFADMAMRGLTVPILSAIPTSGYPTPAKRPSNSRLSTAKFEHDFEYKPRHWNLAIDEILAERLGIVKTE